MSADQAAERLRVYLRYIATGGRNPYAAKWPLESLAADQAKLVSDYLDLFDLTPLTEEILELSGFAKSYKGWIPRDAGGIALNREWIKADGSKGPWRATGNQPGQGPQTVGDLRRLLSALHIDQEVRLP